MTAQQAWAAISAIIGQIAATAAMFLSVVLPLVLAILVYQRVGGGQVPFLRIEGGPQDWVYLFGCYWLWKK